MVKFSKLFLCIAGGLLLGFVTNSISVTYAKTGGVNQTQQKLVCKGEVFDSKAEPIIGASVVVKGTHNGTVTNVDGKFELSNVKPGSQLEFSSIGFKSKTVIFDGNPLKVTLPEDTELLDEVVVTALGIKRQTKVLSYNVQEIKGDALTTVKQPNMINSLNGKIAGVTINKSASGMGGATRVVMRGAKSIEGDNNVLYVIDGMPIYNTSVGQNSGIQGEGRVGSEGIADFNPDDVESISVLSGPSAAALYGSSAANGVIIITTKKGKEGKAKIDLSSSFEFCDPFILPRFQNTYGNKPGSFESWGDKLETPSSYNPRKDFFITGTNIMNSATLSFGTDKNQTYISIGSTNANGVVPNNNYQRYNFNINNTMKLLDNKLELIVGAQYIKQKDRNMVSQGQYWNPIVAAYLFPRGEDWEGIKSFERWDVDRNIAVQYWPISEGVFGVQNPYWTAYRNLAENNKDRYIFNGATKYYILKWINLAARFRLDKATNKFTRKLYASTSPIWAKDNGFYDFSNKFDTQVYADLMLNINKNIGSFSVTANVGTSLSSFNADLNGYGGNLQLIPNLFTIGNINSSNGSPTEKGGDEAIKNIACFGSLELGYKNMLFLTATGRNDWNSRLVNSAEPSYFYPSIGVSALISQMVDMGKLVDMLKLRASYTQVGSPVSQSGLTPGTYTDKIVGGIIQANTIYPYGDFKAERTKSYEFGLSFKGLKGLSFDVTFYKSNTYNQTFFGDMPGESGYTKAYLQAGNVENKGIEANLGYNLSFSNFAYSTSLVYSRNINTIKEMVSNYKHPLINKVFNIDEVSKGATILKVGGSINDIYASSFLQKDEQGYIYIPESGEISISDSVKPVYLGHTSPDFTLGWSHNFTYKGLSLGLVFNGRFGGVVTSSTQAILDRFGVSYASAQARDNGGVLIPNQGKYDAQTYYALTGASGSANLMGYYTYSATNIRLSQLSLSYNLPKKLFKGYIKGVSISLIGNNLLMIYNKAPYDPELTPSTGTYGIGNDYFMQPSLRSIGGSIKLSL